jgi:NAD(P)-dependent dehydrogenase (short-subunit alcohol dehydrogenase family)
VIGLAEVVVLIGSGSIGQAIARRVGAGKHVVLADLRNENAQAAATVMADAGFDVSTSVIDVSSRESVESAVQQAGTHGSITGLIHAAGVSPSQASRKPSCASTCTAPPSSSMSSVTSLRLVAAVS